MSTEHSEQHANRVVVGVDGSESSRQALRWAAFVATASGSIVQAVTAWQPLSANGWAVGYASMAVPDYWNPAGDAEKVLVETVDEVFGANRPPLLETVVREGAAARVLLEVSAGARLLVVGSRGHGGFAGLLLGSVSSNCAEHAICPVLVVHGSTPVPQG
ncbi:MAG: universal stress protein [Actinomycetota bacterium]|nr:universal stress protein [Actinomycetota bacterium]